MEKVVAERRALHQIPELDDSLTETVEFVRSRLTGLPCRMFSPIRGSVCAFFDAGRDETTAFRADMDALPVTEISGVPYASGHPGIMHACGHDGHTAMALALAEEVGAHLGELPHNVLLIFQPSEETTGGAGRLCGTGLLARYRVRRVFGLHLWPGLPAGSVWSRPGPLMARSSEVTVTLEGKSVHISRYREGVDALSAGAEYLRRAYAMMDQIPQQPPALLRFGRMESGTVRNAVSGRTVLEGSLRTYSEDTFSFCRRRLQEIGRALEEESGCTAAVRLSEGYPTVWNHEALYGEVERKLGEKAPERLSEPVLAAEDFSFYQQEVPGIFFFLGCGDVPALHAPDFRFDDETVLPAGVEFLKALCRMK